MKLRKDGIPRRADVTLDTPIETAIRDAIAAVEAAGAHPLLTEAVVLLGKAKDKVSDWAELERFPIIVRDTEILLNNARAQGLRDAAELCKWRVGGPQALVLLHDIEAAAKKLEAR